MTSRSKIVGISRQAQENTDLETEIEPAPLPRGEAEDGEELILATGDETPEEHGYDEYYDEEDYTTSNWKEYIIPALLGASFVAWTGFYIWTNRTENIAALSGDRWISLISTWSLPAIFIGILWLIMMRSSSKEAGRFADVSLSLRHESDALETRMRTVNEEISLAREFLSQNARELESIGRQSAGQLTATAQQLNDALTDSDAKAKTLEQVSNAATTNLEQLRKHLPVVTSAAKDVTNQIGSAGSNAQTQVKTLIAALQQVADAGADARVNIDGLEERTEKSAAKLSDIMAANAQMLQQRQDETGEYADKISGKLEGASKIFLSKLAEADEDVGALVDVNLAKLTQQVEMLRESISDLGNQSTSEDERVSSIIDRVSAHIEERRVILEKLDEAATERTAQLAFAVEALVTSAKELNESLGDSTGNTEALQAKSDALLGMMVSLKNEVQNDLPNALENAGSLISSNLSKISEATQSAISLDNSSDELLVKLSTTEKLISSQKDMAQALINSSDGQFSAQQDKALALSASLEETRALMESLTEKANDGLVEALGRVRSSTQEAAEASREILNGEMDNVAERLTEQSRSSLSSAIDVQVAALNQMVQNSFENNISLSDAAAQRITAQLAEIETMTSNLEARAEASRESFAAIDDDSFARNMVTLTESLNSTAIDVTKILSHEVADTEWAAYLKGDRGVFTRRAVKLLDNGEAKAIAAHYDDDPEFAEHVNRYIHDFESMMRVLLSTRDGNAIGVTLLSSDVGKLYVALAQAIERLRQ